ncbi:MAG: nuclease-related domain-containing protein [Nitrososphaerota archaeon]
MKNSSSDLDVKPEIVTRIVENLLKLTSHGNKITIDVLAEHSVVSRDVAFKIVSRLLGKDFNVNCVEVTGDTRLSIILKCIRDYAPAEVLARHVSWKDFEVLSAKVLNEYGFNVLTNVRLRLSKKKCELDVLAVRSPTVLLLDCKKWNAVLSGKRLTSIVESHMRRGRMLAEYLLNMLGKGETTVEIVPAVLTLYGSNKRVENGVAIVPVGLLGNFIEKLPEIKYDLECIRVKVGSALDYVIRKLERKDAPQRPYGSS